MNIKIKFKADKFGYKANDIVELPEAEANEFISKGHAEAVEENDALDTALQGLEEKINKAAEKAAETAATKVTEKLAKGVSKTRIVVGNDNIEEDPQRGFKSYGEFLMTVKNAHNDGESAKRLKLAGLTGGVGADGGVLLPARYAEMQTNGIIDESLIGRTNNVNLTGDGRTMSFPAVKRYNRGNTDAALGALAYWIAEGAAKTVSKPQFEIVTLTLKKCAAVLPVTDEMLQDFGGLESVLLNEGTTAINEAVNAAIIRGNGTTAPTGILGHAVTLEVARDASMVTNVTAMYSRFGGNRSNAVWIVNPAILGSLMTMQIGNWPVFVPPGGLSASPYSTLFGIPVIPSAEASELGTAGDIILADLKQYSTLTKGGIQVASSIHVYFLSDETAFRFVYRMDGKPRATALVTPKNSADTLAPFVVLEDAA